MRVLPGAPVPGRPLDGRSAGHPRPVPRGQGRQPHPPQGARRRAADGGAGCGRQHPVHGAHRERRSGRGGLPLLPGRGRGALPPVHPDRGARHRGIAARGRRRLGDVGPRGSASLHPGREPGDVTLRDRGRVGPIPVGRVRRVGAARRGHGVRADLRCGARLVGRGAALGLHLRGDVRQRADRGAHRRRLQLRPLCRAEVPPRQHPRQAPAGDGRLTGAAQVRDRQAGLAAPVLPRVPGALRVPRRVPAQPVHRDAVRGARPQLPVRGLPRRSSPTSTGRCA